MNFFIPTTFAATDPEGLKIKGESSANIEKNADLTDVIFGGLQDYMLDLYLYVAIGIFVYIGYLFLTANGNEDQFKKAWTAAFYAILGIAIVPLGYAIIKIAMGLNL